MSYVHTLIIFRDVVDKIVKFPPKHAVGNRIIRVFKSVEKPSNHLNDEEIDEMLQKVSKEEVTEALTDIKDPDEAMEILMRFLELQDDDLNTRTEIAGHIQVNTYFSLKFSKISKYIQVTFLKNGTESLPKITSENLKN